jgi:hypothetical protein
MSSLGVLTAEPRSLVEIVHMLDVDEDPVPNKLVIIG